MNSRITKASKNSKESIVGVFVEKNGERRDMRRCGRRKAINDKHHTLKNMVPTFEGNRGMRHGGKTKFHNMSMFSFGNPFVEGCRDKILDE
jgi:hypothetical protein